MTVPAGSYVLEATVNVNASPKGVIGCSIETTGTTYDGKAVDPAADGANEVSPCPGGDLHDAADAAARLLNLLDERVAGNARLFAIKTGRILRPSRSQPASGRAPVPR